MKTKVVAMFVLVHTMTIQAHSYFMCRDLFNPYLTKLNVDSYSVLPGLQGEHMGVFMSDGISRVDGRFLGITGSRIDFIVVQSMPKTEASGNRYREVRISLPAADVLTSTLFRQTPKVRFVLENGSKIEGIIVDVQKTQVKLQGGENVALKDIQKVEAAQARSVRVTYNKETKDGIEIINIENGLFIKNNDNYLWFLELNSANKIVALHKVRSTHIKLENIEFLDMSKVYRNQKLGIMEAGIFSGGEISNLTSTLLQKTISVNFKGARFAIQPLGSLTRRYFPIQGVNLENTKGLKLSEKGTVEIASTSTRIASLENRIYTDVNVRDLPRGNIFSFVITGGKKPGIRLGLIEGEALNSHPVNERYVARQGLLPIKLAQGERVLSEGEILIDSNGNYSVLIYKTGDYVDRLIRHSSTNASERNATFEDIQNRTIKTFAELFGYNGKVLKSVDEQGNQNYITSTGEISSKLPEISKIELEELWKRSKEFREINPGLFRAIE